MKIKTKKTDVSSVTPFFLFAFFAITVMAVLLLGAKLYREQTQRDLIGYNNRTVSQYITTRIHQSDKYNSYFVGDFNDKAPKSSGNAFFFTETISGEEYYTCIYCNDGDLYELFASTKDSPGAEAGEPILQVKSVHFTNDNGNITVKITHSDNSVQTIVINLRCREGRIA